MDDADAEGVHRASGRAERTGDAERDGEDRSDGGDERDLRQREAPPALQRGDLTAEHAHELVARLRALCPELALELRLVVPVPESHRSVFPS